MMKITKSSMFLSLVFAAAGRRYLCIVVLLFATHTGAGEYLPASLDKEALRLLIESRSALPLRETKLSIMVPVHNVDTGGELPWPEAVAMADERFPELVDRRALFLWQFIRKGMSTDILSDLGQPKLKGDSITVNGRTISFGLEVTLEVKSLKIVSSPDGVPRDVPIIIHDEKSMLLVQAKGSRDAPGQLLGPGELHVKRLVCREIEFDRVTFDVERRLTGFYRVIELNKEGVTLVVGGNASGNGGIDSYYAMVHNEHQILEKIEYNPDLTMKYRSVRQSGTRRTKYLETYKGGKLYRRIHYGPKETDGVIRHETLRVEEFE